MKKHLSVVSTELDEGAVLLNLDTKYYFKLNETGLRIWQIMDECQDPATIAEKIACEYDVTLDRSTASVVSLMSALKKEGLVI